jgi:ribosome-binding factor A
MERVREAIAVCLEAEEVQDDELNFVGVQRVSVST